MRWWRFPACLILAAAIGAGGCGSSKSSGVAITISPTAASVITNRTQQFSPAVTGSSNQAVTWSLTCQSGVTSCGAIDAAGLYTAPATVPTVTSSGSTTPTPAPTVTIKGTAQADTSKTATATVTIVTGISITIAPTTATVGTGENFLFSATVSNPGCNLTSNPTCENVTWSLPTSTSTFNPGTIGSTTGVYTAPSSVPTPSTVTVTATSVADTSVTATASATVVTAADPTVTSVSPRITALGGLFQDVYITGTNFISTNIVYVNNTQLAPALVAQVSSSLIRARIPDFILASPPTATGSNSVLISVSKQTGSKISCPTGSDQSPCTITFVNARPGLVGPTPVRIPQGTTGVQTFDVDGGFFGTGSNPAAPAVFALFNNELRGIQLPSSQTIGSTRQLKVTIGGTGSSDFTVPGLYPVAIKNASDTSKFAVANLAVQPNYNGGSSLTDVKDLTQSDGIGMAPSAVAIDSALGIAVVANTNSNSVTLIDITGGSPPGSGSTVLGTICTGGTVAGGGCATSGPTSVAVDDVLHEALVVNAASKSIAVVDLKAPQSVLPTMIQLQDTPGAVGVNPVTGLALVAMQQKNYGVVVDLNVKQATGIVSISSGTNTKVAVEPTLNWALATPGGAGSLGIVDLGNQSSNVITAISRTTNVVTVTVQSTGSAPPLSVVAGDAVDIQQITFPASAGSAIDALAPTFDGFYTVSTVGPGPNQFSYSQTGATQTDVATQSTPQSTSAGIVSYSQPVATVGLSLNEQGIAINPETQQAVLVDPTTGLSTFFSLIDQTVATSSSLTPDVGVIAAAYNPLTDAIVTVNSFANTLSVIDPVTRTTLKSTATRPGAAAVAIDPGTNTAVVANQTDNSVSVFNLGPIQPFSIADTSPKTFISSSTLGSGPNPGGLTLTVVGTGLTCTGGTTRLEVRLDGAALPNPSCVGGSNRELTATVPSSKLTSAHRFALDVFNPDTGQVTNSEDFTVVRSVDVTGCSLNPTSPEPSGVAIDPVQNLAAVTLFGCNSLALINMSTGTGTTVTVGANPIGVAVLPRLHLAATANNGATAGSASIVDEFQQSVKQNVTTGAGSIGVAANEATGEFAIANSQANTVTVVNAVNGGTSTISTGQRPIAVAFNYVNHQVAAAATGSNLLGISGGSTGSTNQSFSVQAPTSVVYDPVPTDCGSNSNGTTTNTTGCFIVAASTENSVQIIDPVNSAQTSFRMGINPTAIAYNFRTSTLVSTNTGSHTLTVADLLGQSVRAVLSLSLGSSTNSNLALNLAASGALQYALDIDPFTNIAVIADTANGRVLFVPLPR